MSIIGTFSVMYLFHFSLDNISLMALTLCVGFVVDDAIVMLENIARHLEMGKKPVAGDARGGREVAFTIVSMTLSLMAVFIPVLFMGGILGRLLREFFDHHHGRRADVRLRVIDADPVTLRDHAQAQRHHPARPFLQSNGVDVQRLAAWL
ncbi:efflux RND transporter permease subunit [Undibacterium arcticum]